MVEYPDVDLVVQKQVRHDFLSVKFFYEGKWQMVQLPVILHKKAQEVLAVSQAETNRIKSKTLEIKSHKAKKEKWTKEEIARILPRDWCAASLALYAKRDKQYPGGLRFALHVPFEKWRDAPQKAKEQLVIHPGMPVVAVDLGVNLLAVMGAFQENKLQAGIQDNVRL